MFLQLSIVIAVLCVVSQVQVQGNVMGIDFGSDSMKIAIVQPGTPLEIGKIADTNYKYHTSYIFILIYHSYSQSISYELPVAS